jgi:hypothetical protein
MEKSPLTVRGSAPWPRHSHGSSSNRGPSRPGDSPLNQYKAGTVPYSSVITAQTTHLSAEQTALAVLSSRLQASVALIEAVGGGWNASQLPLP